MPGIMTKQGIPRFRLGDQRFIRRFNIRLGRLRISLLIQQDRDITLLKSVDILNVLDHVPDIVVASTQFTRRVADVIDPNQQGATRPRAVVRHQIKLGIHVNRFTRRELLLLLLCDIE